MYLQPLQFYYDYGRAWVPRTESYGFFPGKYLVNGESDQKSVPNEKDAEFNFLYGMCYQI